MSSMSVPAGVFGFQSNPSHRRTSGRAARLRSRQAGRRETAGEAALFTARRGWYAVRRWWWKPVWHLRVSGVEHLPRRGAFLLCGNHASHLDAPAILAALPRDVALRATTAAARDVFGRRWWRQLAARLTTNALTLQRESDFAGGLRALEAVLNDGRPLVLFPEGKRSTTGELLPFKLGAAMLALRTGTPIVPVRLTGCEDALPKGSSVPSPANVSVRFGEPISPAPYQQAIAEGRMIRREAYEQLTAEVRGAIETMGRQATNS